MPQQPTQMNLVTNQTLSLLRVLPTRLPSYCLLCHPVADRETRGLATTADDSLEASPELEADSIGLITRLRFRPKLLLQLQQVSQAPRPLPVVDVLPSTSYLSGPGDNSRRFIGGFTGTRGRLNRTHHHSGYKPRTISRPKTSYQFAHPAAHARHKRLRFRPKLLLQLQQVSHWRLHRNSRPTQSDSSP
jgi:hypothetical protein